MMKTLAFVFWDIRRFFRFTYDDGLADFKALAVMVCTELLAIVTVACVISLMLGHRVIPTAKPVLYLLASGFSIAVTGVNYYCYKHKWTRFEVEFEHYSTRARLAGRIAILAVVCANFVAALIFIGQARYLPRM